MTSEEFSYWASHDLNKLREMIAEEGRKVGAEIEDRYLVMAGELMLAGWTPEYKPQNADRCMSWYWRRPKKLPWTRGRLFMSTDQAWNNMMKDRL